jgi:hypothetical protein
MIKESPNKELMVEDYLKNSLQLYAKNFLILSMDIL